MGEATKSVTEYGDFQTPRALAQKVCRLLSARGISPAAVLEPTCGLGNFLCEVMHGFPQARRFLGFDINRLYVAKAREETAREHPGQSVVIEEGNFFDLNWKKIVDGLPRPLLVIGNPPWVTNSALAALGSGNLPEKSNFHNHRGFAAKTGKSNFDISEWMLIRLLEVLDGEDAMIAMLTKTAVARKVLLHAWKKGLRVEKAEVYSIDAVAHFSASVEACLMVCKLSPTGATRNCAIHKNLDSGSTESFGFRDGRLIAETEKFERWRHLLGQSPYKWRSGIKHDCSKVMEFRRDGAVYINGYGERVELEDDYLYPMLKSSDLANGEKTPERWMLVTQRFVGDDTSTIARHAPMTWKYLRTHAEELGRRGSSIYKDKPEFSIFGVGEYSFSRWKVAISALYKKLEFRVLGDMGGKPIVLDDTGSFVSCESQEEAEYLAGLLNSAVARDFYNAFIFWDAKRPITIDLLDQLDLHSVAHECGSAQVFRKFRNTLAHSGHTPFLPDFVYENR